MNNPLDRSDLYNSCLDIDEFGELMMLRGTDNSCGIFVSTDTKTEFCEFSLPPTTLGRDEAKRIILALVDWMQIIKTENGINEQ
jgi:hypothetical protein